MIVRLVQEYFELRIRDGISINVKAGNAHRVLMETSSGLLPWIRDIYAYLIASFDFDSFYSEVEVAGGNLNHILRNRPRSLRGHRHHHVLVQRLPFMGEASQGLGRHSLHFLDQGELFRCRLTLRGQDCAEAVGLDWEVQNNVIVLASTLNLHAVIEVIKSLAITKGDRHLLLSYGVFIAVHNGPQCLTHERPAAREHAEIIHRIKRLPVRADEERRCRSLNRRHPSRCLSVPWRNAIPNSPDVLPAFPSDTVEESLLKVVDFVPAPSIGDVRHVPRLEPLVAVNSRHKLRVLARAFPFGRILFPPREDIPSQSFIAREVLRLKRERMTYAFRRLRKNERNAILGIAIDPIGANLRHQLCDRLWPRPTRIACSLVPHIHGKQDPDSAAVKVRDHLLDAGRTPRHRENHVKLIAVIDSKVRVYRPNEYGIDSSVASGDVIGIPVHRILTRRGVIQIAVLYNCLWLDETRLCPLQRRGFVSRWVITNVDPAFQPPVIEEVDELSMCLGLTLRRREMLSGEASRTVDHERFRAVR